jgi:MFS family permease
MEPKATGPEVQISRGVGANSPIDESRLSSPNEITPALGLEHPMSRISTRSAPVFKVYKRRFWGLAQLVLLNIIVSWDWVSFAPVSKTSAQYFKTSESIINWLSTAFLFAFCVATPPTFYALNKRGPKFSIVVAAILLLVGNWIRYGGTKANNFGVVMLGQLLIGFAQPFVLCAPTSYSNTWFSDAGRTTATAVSSLANPFGAALGQLIDPSWATNPSDIPNMVLYISIISSVACIPSFFIPAKPPSPPSAGASVITHQQTSISHTLSSLFRSLEFYLIATPFAFYVGFFNSFTTLLNQILEPYGYSETEAGIAGALIIVVGLVSAAISSPLIDKYKFYLAYIKVAVPVTALSYLVFIWAPSSHTIVYAYVVCAIMGASSFGLVPVVLEFLVEIHHPLGPELGSSVCWFGGQILGGSFVIIQTALKAGPSARPPANLHAALIFQAVISMAIMPLPLCLGLFGRGKYVRSKRLEADRDRNVADAQMDRPSSEDGILEVEGGRRRGEVRI